ncbi:hypothetical protein SeLEV6574_g03319 [Synchytrium endobioticum]|uniref:Uncharacterized protein n=1 Tax=Synchytrium endobioticum TaxID=286115 RepID=A0A507D456_9FUNG|nr:hypothetical protein SeLEV6574_g03319 [Synchytrium endobioticum]
MAASSSHTNCSTSLETVALRPSRVSNSSWSWSLKFVIEGGVKAFATRPIGFAGIYGVANLDELGQPLLLPFIASSSSGSGGLATFYTSKDLGVEASQDVDVDPALVALTVDTLQSSRHAFWSGVVRDSKLALEVNGP